MRKIVIGAMAAAAVAFGLPAYAQSFDWKKHQGQTINVALAKQPWSDFITPLIPEFEKLTGIKVRLEVLSME